MRPIPDASAESLMPFIDEAIEPGSSVRTDGWLGYSPLQGKGYRHRIIFLKGQKESASELLPRVHLVASLPKRWLLGTHQGAISREHLAGAGLVLSGCAGLNRHVVGDERAERPTR